MADSRWLWGRLPCRCSGAPECYPAPPPPLLRRTQRSRDGDGLPANCWLIQQILGWRRHCWTRSAELKEQSSLSPSHTDDKVPGLLCPSITFQSDLVIKSNVPTVTVGPPVLSIGPVWRPTQGEVVIVFLGVENPGASEATRADPEHWTCSLPHIDLCRTCYQKSHFPERARILWTSHSSLRTRCHSRGEFGKIHYSSHPLKLVQNVQGWSFLWKCQ